jgi:hypothetical protein
MLDVSSNATQQELYIAFEEKVLHTPSEFREEICAEQFHIEYVQEFEEYNAHHDPWIFTEELPGEIEPNLKSLVAA